MLLPEFENPGKMSLVHVIAQINWCSVRRGITGRIHGKGRTQAEADECKTKSDQEEARMMKHG